MTVKQDKTIMRVKNIFNWLSEYKFNAFLFSADFAVYFLEKAVISIIYFDVKNRFYDMLFKFWWPFFKKKNRFILDADCSA